MQAEKNNYYLPFLFDSKSKIETFCYIISETDNGLPIIIWSITSGNRYRVCYKERWQSY